MLKSRRTSKKCCWGAAQMRKSQSRMPQTFSSNLRESASSWRKPSQKGTTENYPKELKRQQFCFGVLRSQNVYPQWTFFFKTSFWWLFVAACCSLCSLLSSHVATTELSSGRMGNYDDLRSTDRSPLCVCSLGQPLKPVLHQDFQPVTVELGILQST